MPSYHSLFNKKYYNKACDFPLIPFTQGKKPLLDYKLLKNENKNIDIIDEVLLYFRANILFKSYKIKSDADKIIVYLSVFLCKCLSVLEDCHEDPKKSKDILKNLISECGWNSNSKTHFLNTIVTVKSNESSELSSYLKSLREETVARLYSYLFELPGSNLDMKYWMGYSKKLFLGYEMPQVKRY